MISVRIQGNKYSIAENIYEVDIHRLIKASSEREELAAISDIPLSLVARLDLDTFLPLIEFLNADYDYVSLDVKCKNVSQEPYEKLELAKKAMQDHEKLYMQVYHVAAVYHPERKKSIPIFQTGINLIHQIGLFLDEFAEMNQEEPDSFEKAAGIDKLTELGSFGTAYNLAGKDLTKMDAITEMPAVVVYTALLYNYRESKYMDELNRLKYPPK
jgi:hypothetical protein